jgi:hypothetical protein
MTIYTDAEPAFDREPRTYSRCQGAYNDQLA